ncbi:helix-turn-helix domain-containing protein [Niabella sp.]|uniref:helix-turn-helix domain-containing protein n=1 Tax=Niabella sp. TaxID=1962976 RepID=UPI0026212857|nr:helix-turn-helix domain-containing protein [Niabella sp.]
MSIKAFRVWILLLAPVFVKAQDSAAYNRIYDQAMDEIAPKNMDRAIAIADSLYRSSKTPEYKVRSLMLIASFYEFKEAFNQSISYAERSYALIKTTDNYNWRVRVCGFLAAQYRKVRLYDQSKAYALEARQLAHKINRPGERNATLGMIQQELAYSEMAQEHYPEAIRQLQNAQPFFNHTEKNRDFFTADNEQQLGQCYDHMKIYDSAIYHYKNALILLPGAFNHVTGQAYAGLAAIYTVQNELKTAQPYIDSAAKLAATLEDLRLKNRIYKVLQTYYAKTQDLARMEAARNTLDTVAEQLSKNTASFYGNTFLSLKKKQAAAEEKSSRKTWYMIACLLLLGTGMLFFIRYRSIQQKKLEQFKRILEQAAAKERQRAQYAAPIDTRQPPAPLPAVAETVAASCSCENAASIEMPEKDDKKDGLVLPPETEQKLLQNLEAFEHSGQYTSNDMSLPFLAAHLNTNTKYLSFVIRKYKQKDFNSYINELRINYVIDMLKSNKAWRQYKISTLAATAGFSSHSQFAAIFKTFTGLSPSVFIRYLNHEG